MVARCGRPSAGSLGMRDGGTCLSRPPTWQFLAHHWRTSPVPFSFLFIPNLHVLLARLSRTLPLVDHTGGHRHACTARRLGLTGPQLSRERFRGTASTVDQTASPEEGRQEGWTNSCHRSGRLFRRVSTALWDERANWKVFVSRRTYSVLVQVGGIETPLVLGEQSAFPSAFTTCLHLGSDTGSADLWVVSDSCSDCVTEVQLYPQATFQPTGLTAQLLYGDSRTGTHATGPIGKDKAGVAGLTINDQYFAAIVDTNTTVLETGVAGIFGTGFPAVR